MFSFRLLNHKGFPLLQSALRLGASVALRGPKPSCRSDRGNLFVLLALAMGLAAPAIAGAQAPDVSALVRQVDRLWRGDSSHAVMSMTVKTRHYQRKMTMESWSEGKEKSLVVIRAPKKDRGVATLKVDSNIWNYLPKINRVTKIPPSMMMGSWMGSHFTNDDLVRENTYEEDFINTLGFSGERNGVKIHEVISIPKDNAAVIWGKVLLVILQDSLLPLRAEYFDEEGQMVRVLRFEDHRRMGGRLLPARLVLVPMDKPDEHTTVIYEDIEFEVNAPVDLFSLRRLRTGG